MLTGSADCVGNRTVRWVLALALLILGGGGASLAADPVETALAADGKALHRVIVAESATEQTRATAETLAAYLGRIAGAPFEVASGDGTTGIAVGRAEDFPTLGLATLFAPTETLRREEYLLRSGANGVLLLGATDAGVEHAVWDLLHRLGYRQFFPGDTWEIVPRLAAPKIAVDTFEQPDFHTRRIWYGHGTWDYNVQPYRDWCARNRAVVGFGLSTSHCYQSIIRRHAAVFKEHPEYLALVDGERKGTKFCISNPDLRRFVVENYALAAFRDDPTRDSVSMEPSDGGGWCECAECAALGSISDRALLLANEAAAAIAEAYPGKYVGFLAYSQHSPPPSIRVHPNVIVKVQTAFIRGGYTFDELIEGWQRQGARVGVGDYYSVFLWDMSRPASQRGSDIHYVTTTVPKFHRQGARFFMSESSDLWGGIGLGHYLAARMLWDVSEADRAEALTADFLERSFGPAKEPMEAFFRLIYRFGEDDRRPLIRQDMLARMYRSLAAARAAAGDDPGIRGRLDHLLLYTRYEDLFQTYQGASGAARQEAVEALLRHTWRMRETMMLHAKPITMRLAGRDSKVTMPPADAWKVNQPFNREELAAMLSDGVARTEPVEVGFEPVAFSRDLVPAAPLRLPEVERGSFSGGAPMGRQTFYTWLTQPGELKLTVSGGHIVHYRKFAGNVQTRLYADANPVLDEPVAMDDSVAPNGEEFTVALKSPYPGLHRLDVWPPSNRAMIDTLDPDTPLTMEASLDEYNRLTSRWSLCFYVPKGTRVVGGFADGSDHGTVLDGAGNVRFSFREDMPQMPGFFRIEVPEGQDGTLWRFHQCISRRALLTVPPFLARNGRELLLPREVVEKDSRP